MAEKKYTFCTRCGEALTDNNTWMGMNGKYTPVCLKCQPKIYMEQAKIIGFTLAMWTCALQFNMPYLPELLEEAKQYQTGKNPWQGYIVALAKNGIRERMDTFENGVIDIRKAFGGNMAALYIDNPYDDEEMESCRKAQEIRWGDSYGQEELDFLDTNYDALTESRAYISSQTELTIKQICEYKLAAQSAMKEGRFDDAKKINSMIKELMESEQLRKKDELPQDRARLDDIVLAVERAGLHIMDYEELCNELANHALHETYPYTRDAADQVILQIRNTTAWNEGVAEVASLPTENRVVDHLDEFAKSPDEIENKVYTELGLSRMDGQ